MIIFDSDAETNDEVKAARRRLAAYLAHKGAKVQVTRIPAGKHGQKVGIDDFLAAGGSLPTLLKNAVPIEALEEAWPEPKPLPPRTAQVPTLDPELLPSALRPWALDVAERGNYPLEFVAVPLIATLGLVAARWCAICPKARDESWKVLSNLWGLIVAPPGTLKSAALEEPISILDRTLVRRARTRYAKTLEQIERLAREIEKVKQDKSQDVAALTDELHKLRGVVENRYQTNDATIQKIGQLLAGDSRGLLVHRDEFGGFFKNLTMKNREGDRAFFNESWNGTAPYNFDTISRGNTHVPRLCLSLLGGIQPGPFEDFLETALEPGAGADGLVQRLQLVVWPDSMPAYKKVDREEDHAARKSVEELFLRLDAKSAPLAEAEPPDEELAARLAQEARKQRLGVQALGPAPLELVHFTPEAQEVFDAWRDALEHRLREKEVQEKPAFAGHLSKYRKLMPALALIFGLVENGKGGKILAAIGLEATQLAVRWVKFLESHARKMYAVELEPGHAAALVLAKRIESGALHDHMTVRDINRCQWRGLTDDDAVAVGLRQLETLDWVRVRKLKSSPKGGAPSTVVEINPGARP